MSKRKSGKKARGKKDNFICCRVTDEQYQLVEGLSMEHGCNMSTILRESLDVVFANPHLMKILQDNIKKKPGSDFEPEKHWYNSLEFIKSLLSEKGELAVSALIHFKSGFANLYPGMKVEIDDDFIIFKVAGDNELQLDVNDIEVAYISNGNDDSEELYRPRELNKDEYVTIWTS